MFVRLEILQWRDLNSLYFSSDQLQLPSVSSGTLICAPLRLSEPPMPSPFLSLTAPSPFPFSNPLPFPSSLNCFNLFLTSPRTFGYKVIFGMNCYCFRYDFSAALISALALLKYPQSEIKCSGLKIDWGSPNGVQLLTECVLRHYSLLFYTRFCRLGLFMPNNLSSD